ncbi:glycerate kinase [Vibrio maerlii]|uniref:glycerate kinase n=1 Tax=Vibrio maerlii TaxID=2231648 RepID=UPI000E3BE491|nr:glycerate kinase [Vibrio maerlii]
MKIVIAPDSFKESLSAQQVADTIKAGFQTQFADAEYITLPIADGGEGTLDALVAAKGGEVHSQIVEGPLGQDVTARWGHFSDQGISTAIIELAEASGIALNDPDDRDIERASTFGTGQLIKAALDNNVRRIILCLGGSATNDAGAGIAQALGVQLKDHQGNELARGGKALLQLASIDATNLHSKAQQVEWLIACDVSNPLCGDQGASAVFGPQKGASAEQVQMLDSALTHFADKVADITGINHQDSAGFGAAGGTPLGVTVCGEPTLKPGIDIVLEAAQLEQCLKDADLVITGEGQMDFQTLFGKAPFGVASRAKKLDIPTIGIAGSLGKDLTGLDEYFSAVFATVRSPQPLQQVLEEADHNLRVTSENVASALAMKLES